MGPEDAGSTISKISRSEIENVAQRAAADCYLKKSKKLQCEHNLTPYRVFTDSTRKLADSVTLGSEKKNSGMTFRRENAKLQRMLRN